MRSALSRNRVWTAGGLALGLVLLGTAAVEGQQAPTRCAGGWAASCASVEVDVVGDQLVFYVPNPSVRKAGGEARDGSATQRVRVLRSLPGQTCDPATGIGCEDVTAAWSGGVDPDLADSAEDCRSEDSAADEATSGEAESASDCAAALLGDTYRDGAVLFAVAVPSTAFLWMPEGGDPTIVRSARDDDEDDGEGEGEDDGNGDDGEGGDNGEDGEDNGDNGDTSGDNGDSGGDNGDNGDTSGDNGDDGDTSGDNGDNGDNGDTSGDNGDNGGDDGDNGGDNGDTEGDGQPWPGGGDNGPPMTEVPEPVTTTLVGLGLLGYAGARLRRRSDGEVVEEEPLA